MKFLNIRNRGLLTGLFLLISLCPIAQTGEYSPYSRFGIGSLQPGVMSSHLGMGGLTAPVNDPHTINTANPATYASLANPTFQIGIRSVYVTQSDLNQSQKINFSSLNNINFAFPFGKSRWTLGFGLMPYSRVGYNLISSSDTEAGEVDFIYTGEGGLNKAYLGLAKGFEIKKTTILKDSTGIPLDTIRQTKHLFSVGSNFDYFFGSLNRSRRVEFNNTDYFNSRFSNVTKLQNPGFDFGLHYFTNLVEKREKGELKKRVNLRAGLTFSPEIRLNSNVTELGETFKYSGGNIRVVDTSYYAPGVDASTYIPQSYSGGLSLEFINSKDNNLTLGVDYKFQEWSKYRVKLNDEEITDPLLTNASQISAGIEYTPRYFSKPNLGFFQVIRYRAGYRITNSYLQIDGQQLNETAFTAGFTLPLEVSRSSSRINFGMEFGKRGNKNPGFVEEKFVNFQLGLVMTPYYRSGWFIKSKYD